MTRSRATPAAASAQTLLVQNVSVILAFRYLLRPTVMAPCGSAADRIQWSLSGVIPKGVHAIVQMVTRTSDIQRSGLGPIAQAETFFELWDVDVLQQGQAAILGNGQDEFAWHDQAGPGTKGSWLIRGVARFLPGFDVLDAIARGEPWRRGVIKGAGNWLYTLTTTPRAWDQFSSQTARTLTAQWNCFPKDARRETDITGSGPAAP
jgi:hypothetical protein